MCIYVHTLCKCMEMMEIWGESGDDGWVEYGETCLKLAYHLAIHSIYAHDNRERISRVATHPLTRRPARPIMS